MRLWKEREYGQERIIMSCLSGVLTDRFPVVPSLVVHPLSQQLNRRLGTIHLQHRHVEIIHKEYGLLA